MHFPQSHSELMVLVEIVAARAPTHNNKNHASTKSYRFAAVMCALAFCYTKSTESLAQNRPNKLALYVFVFVYNTKYTNAMHDSCDYIFISI